MKKQILLSMVTTIFCVAILPAQYISIPDKGFEKYLIRLGIDTEGQLDGRVSTKDINKVDRLEIGFLVTVIDTIHSLKGIEYFKALESLSIEGRDEGTILIDSLDLSPNTRLSSLYIADFNLKFLDISKNDINYLYLENIKIKSINLSSSRQIIGVQIQETLLDSIDLSYGIKNKLPVKVLLSNNRLKYLNLSNIHWFPSVYTAFEAAGNPDLHCIYIANSDFNIVPYTNIDSTAHLVKSEAECDSVTAVRSPVVREEIYISPNPTQDQVDIALPSRGGGYDRLRLYDFRGQRVMTIPVDPHRTDYHISLRDVPEGLYLLVATGLSGKEKTLTRKLVKY